MTKHRQKPEGKLVSHVNFMHNTVTNDRHKIDALHIKAPQRRNMYATAFCHASKIEMWFRTPGQFDNWKNKQESLSGWRITIQGQL